MNIDNKIEQFFNENNKGITIEEIIKNFKVPERKIIDVIETLYDMEKKGTICMIDGCYVHVPKNFYLKHGKIRISNKGKAYITLPDKSNVSIFNNQLHGAVKGDTVFFKLLESNKHKKNFMGEVVRVVKKPKCLDHYSYLTKTVLQKNSKSQYYYIKLENDNKLILIKNAKSAYPGDKITVEVTKKKNEVSANVVEVIERKQDSHVFEYAKRNGIMKWIPFGVSEFDVELLETNELFLEGDRILARLLEEQNNIVQIEFQEKLKHSNQLNSIVEAIAYNHGFKVKFPKKCNKEISKMSSIIDKKDYEERVDLRNLTTFTIDGKDAKDKDDAVSLESLGEEGYRLYVHIADVFHYVKPGMEIFKEAEKRTTSIYPLNFVIPMLQPELSNDICSLNEKENKLTITCRMDIDLEGNVYDFTVFKSIINSDCSMIYSSVNELLENQSSDHPYSMFYQKLKEMSQLRDILDKKRSDSGQIKFFTQELELQLDDENKVVSVEDRECGIAQSIIENFMIVANATVGSYAFWLDLDFTYRNHNMPAIDKICQLNKHLNSLGDCFRKLKKVINSPTSFQKALSTLCEGKSLEERRYVSDLFLNYIPRAYYSEVCEGHYGLALEQYATFTSPIRRFSDLMNHRALYTVIGNQEEIQELNRENLDLKQICDHISERQIEAEKVETEVNCYFMKEYLSTFLDCELEARIIVMTEVEMYIEVLNKFTGTIPLNRKYHYHYDTKQVRIAGKDYKAGDSIMVKIKKVDNTNCKILFELSPMTQEIELKQKTLVKKKG